jgi:flagellar protein FlbT
MPLRLSLKPNERAIIGGAVIKNGPKSSSFTIENQTILLREKDILTEDSANTPAKRLYLIVQLMYLCGGLDEAHDYHAQFFKLTREFIAACPTEKVLSLVAEIGYNLLDNNFYHALKLCKELVEYEHGILNGTMNIQEKNITSPQQEAAPES